MPESFDSPVSGPKRTLCPMNELFRKVSSRTGEAIGSSWAFIVALLVIFVWGVSGPIFGFSDTWQLVINTGTTIVTFLAVFLIQNMQNRDAKAIHLKLDELIRSIDGARTGLVNLEELPDREIQELADDFKRIHDEQHEDLALEEAASAAAQAKPRPRHA